MRTAKRHNSELKRERISSQVELTSGVRDVRYTLGASGGEREVLGGTSTTRHVLDELAEEAQASLFQHITAHRKQQEDEAFEK